MGVVSYSNNDENKKIEMNEMICSLYAHYVIENVAPLSENLSKSMCQKELQEIHNCRHNENYSQKDISAHFKSKDFYWC